jgi:hypothetical protein
MARKNRFFWPLTICVYFRLTVLRFFCGNGLLKDSVKLPNPALRCALQEQDMKKTFAAMVAVATVAGALNTTPAHAQRGVAAGVAAGLIGGAIIGGAIASSRPAYGYGAPVYVEEAPYPACRMVRERFWDGYGWRVRRYEVCN